MKETNYINYSKKALAQRPGNAWKLRKLPTFYVVIPCYKPDIDLFAKCLRSIKANKYPKYEVLVVLDGDFPLKSRVEELVKVYGTNFKTLTYSQNLGTYQARLEGYKKVAETINAQDYIINVDCDDTISSSMFNSLSKCNRDIVKFGYSNKLPIDRTNWKAAIKDKDFCVALWSIAVKGDYIKKIIPKIKSIPNFIYGEDAYFMYLLSLGKPTYRTIQKSLYNYEINETSICNTLEDTEKRTEYIKKFLEVISSSMYLRDIYREKGFMYYKICEFLSMQQYLLEKNPEIKGITKNCFYGTRLMNFRNLAVNLTYKEWISCL